MVASIKNVKDTRVERHHSPMRNRPAPEPLPGYRRINPMVFCGLVYSRDYEDLKEALEKLELNDASLRYEPDTSVPWALGSGVVFSGFCMEIIQERIEREHTFLFHYYHRPQCGFIMCIARMYMSAD